MDWKNEHVMGARKIIVEPGLRESGEMTVMVALATKVTERRMKEVSVKTLRGKGGGGAIHGSSKLGVHEATLLEERRGMARIFGSMLSEPLN